MNDIFQPFEPTTAAQEPQPPKRRGRKVAQVNSNAAQQAASNVQPAPETPPKRRGRKPGTPNKLRQPSGLKLPVGAMLAAMSKLRGDDSTLFEKLLGILAAAGKGQRDRVLAALAQVF